MATKCCRLARLATDLTLGAPIGLPPGLSRHIGRDGLTSARIYCYLGRCLYSRHRPYGGFHAAKCRLEGFLFNRGPKPARYSETGKLARDARTVNMLVIRDPLPPSQRRSARTIMPADRNRRR